MFQLDELASAWNEFISRQNLLPAIDSGVADSWQRCRLCLNPFQKLTSAPLNQDNLLVMQVASLDLISIARPLMEDIYQSVAGSDTAVGVVNSSGYLLDLLGDASMLQVAARHGIVTGASLAETQTGTNAYALALSTRMPAKVLGAEHFLHDLHDLAEAAAPVFDPTGRLLGALGLLTLAQNYHAHTLGLVVAGGRAIERQRQSDLLLDEQNSHLAELNIILASISEGILVWNADWILIHANAVATQMLNLPSTVLVGRRLDEHFTVPPHLREAVRHREALSNVEVTFTAGGRALTYVLSLRYVEKDQALQWVVATLRQVEEVRQLVDRQVGLRLPYTLDDLIGASDEMQRIRALVRTAAPERASLLIRGERGTGKNLLASIIHNESGRRSRPFVVFGCATIPRDLVVAELLGHEGEGEGQRVGSRPSKFELAEGGTLLLQDVEALPLEAQAVALNVMQLGIVYRLESTRPIPVDVRFIATSSADLEHLIAEGSFRADLFYRLSPFEVHLPPLRERRNDVHLLVDHILKRLSRRYRRHLELMPGAMDLLKQYAWPGNVPEIEGVLERAVVQSAPSTLIGPMHLPDYLRHPAESAPAANHSSRPRPLLTIEREMFIQAARQSHGNVSQMAAILGIGRTTVWRRMKTFHILAKDFRTPEADGRASVLH